MHQSRNEGFTLVELLVVIAIIGTLVGLMLPAMISTRTPSRINNCRNNLRQLQTALATRESSLGNLPGYINSIGPSDKSARASWVVTTFPYIEEPDLWASWSQGKQEFRSVAILICPSDPPVDPEHPALSYVANSGYIANANGQENKANGVFFDRTRTSEGASGPADGRDDLGSPLITMTSGYIQKHDGTSHTLLLAENIHALQWGYVSPEDRKKTPDRKYHYGFCWEQPGKVADTNNPSTSSRRINGNLEYTENNSFQKMSLDEGFPTSNHPGGINVAFAGGSTRFITDQIDPLVYAQLMTSNHQESDLLSVDNKPDKELIQPNDSDF